MIVNPYIFGSIVGPLLKVRLLFNAPDGSGIFMDEQGHDVTGVASPVIKTDQFVEGGSSLYLDASSFLQSANSADFMFPADFKIECWVRPDNLTATGVIYSNQTWSGDASGFALYRNGSSLSVWCGGADLITSGPGVFAVKTWLKVKFERVAGQVSLYANDVQVGSAVPYANAFNSGLFRLGVYSVGGQQWAGYIDAFEIWSG